MPFFEPFLKGNLTTDSNIEMQLQCDSLVFEWLLDYAITKKSPVQVENSMSILVSSYYLKMTQLYDLTVAFVTQNLTTISKCIHTNNAAPITLDFLDKNILSDMAKLLAPMQINKIDTSQTTLKLQLYESKVHLMAKDYIHRAQKCKWCQKIYDNNHELVLQCEFAPIIVSKDGSLVSRHEANVQFNFKEHINELNMKKTDWDMVYWSLWSAFNHFNCSKCGETFTVLDFKKCSAHVSLGTAIDEYCWYECCSLKVPKFCPFTRPPVCKHSSHSPKENESIFQHLHEIFNSLNCPSAEIVPNEIIFLSQPAKPAAPFYFKKAIEQREEDAKLMREIITKLQNYYL
jgi:hypothetical protein